MKITNKYVLALGGFLAAWTIMYGIVQSFAPHLTGKKQGRVPDGKVAFAWAAGLCLLPALIALSLSSASVSPLAVVIVGLLAFGVLFAVNSSLHSYLIVSYAQEDGVSLDVGFYYMSNAMGRLLGTLLSGWLYQQYGLTAWLWLSTLFIAFSALLFLGLPKHNA